MKKEDLKKLVQSLEEVRSKTSSFLSDKDLEQLSIPTTETPNPVSETKKQIIFENSEDFTKTLTEAQKICNQIQNYITVILGKGAVKEIPVREVQLLLNDLNNLKERLNIKVQDLFSILPLQES